VGLGIVTHQSEFVFQLVFLLALDAAVQREELVVAPDQLEEGVHFEGVGAGHILIAEHRFVLGYRVLEEEVVECEDHVGRLTHFEQFIDSFHEHLTIVTLHQFKQGLTSKDF